MSPPNSYTLILSPEAEEDYEGILAYTARQWGIEQVEIYDDLLDRGLQDIETDPRKGRRHPKLAEEVRYYHVKRPYII